MNKILILLGFLIFFNGRGQSIEKLQSKFDWSNYEFKSFDHEDFQAISNIYSETIFRCLDNYDNPIRFFHWVDFDGDQMAKIIYNGPSCGEGSVIRIFNEDLKNINSINGSITWVNRVKNKIESIEVLDYACCAGYVDHLQLFEFNRNTSSFLIKNDLAIISDCELPKNFITHTRFKIVNEIYNLRIHPEIRSDYKVFEYEGLNNQNICAEYSRGNTGTAIASKTDSTGRSWWYVIMDNRPSGKSLFYKGNNEFADYKPTGWLSSRYIEEMDN